MRLTSLPLPPILCLLVALAAPTSSTGADPSLEGWKPGARAEREGYAYRVYSQSDEEGGFVRYRVRGKIAARADSLPAAVRTIASDPAWVPAGQSRKVLVNEPGEFVVHTRIDLPLPFSDRDVVSRGVISVDEATGVHRIEWRAIDHELAPPVDGVVRIRRGAGSWEFTPAAGDACEVDYVTFIDLGGALPGWLINPLMGGNVLKSFEDVARHATRPRTARTR